MLRYLEDSVQPQYETKYHMITDGKGCSHCLEGFYNPWDNTRKSHLR